ncbi:MAG: serine/threonine protein kinase, partial [Acidobacteriota bacterium]|nr:serine/threonine protein kinase [Acidobacteriota bacterium]
MGPAQHTRPRARHEALSEQDDTTLTDTAGSVEEALRRPDDAPEKVGPYTILEKLGEGGMGVVYLAEQRAPIRRRVALKLIKLGMDTAQVVARFESERQALALMDHLNVAKVFDAGSTEQGRPFFAMEHVQGEPIAEYCDRQRLTTADRIELFIEVCDGVQHAHQKGIVHRDLKPSNVLVTVMSDRPVPKIIDFGVAKAIDHRLTTQSVYTRMGTLLGTPEYMSPEQAEMTSLDIDTRTDVYSLGVLLYELLVGTLPFDRVDLRELGFDEMRRKIRQDEPRKPSSRLGTLGERSAEIARRRGVEVAGLKSQIRGDLDWIILRALEKDRARRYQTPVELAADLRRHLVDQPVGAGPPRVTY